jgi:hypothetical protein
VRTADVDRRPQVAGALRVGAGDVVVDVVVVDVAASATDVAPPATASTVAMQIIALRIASTISPCDESCPGVVVRA